MALKIGDNFSYQGKKPNFDRDSFDTLAAMKAFPETSIDEGHISYCKEDGKNYQYKAANSIDGTTGKWREFSSGSGGDAYIIDYITANEGTITEKQYNEIVEAYTNNIPIYIFMYYIKFYPFMITSKNGISLLISEGINVTYIYITSNYLYSVISHSFILSPEQDGNIGQVLKKTAKGIEWANDKDTIYQKVTQQADGLMSKEDKTKLDGLTGASLKILTQEEYDATEPKAEDTVYFIKG